MTESRAHIDFGEAPIAPSGAPVVVSGAGPAGCAAAIALRRRGIPVILIDRARFPRDKVCGDVILPEAFEEIRRLGLPVSELAGRAHRCTGARYVSPSGREMSGEFPAGDLAAPGPEGGGSPRSVWLTLPRFVFDAWLLQAARATGAEVREETEVTGLLRDPEGRVRGLRVRPGAAGTTRSEQSMYDRPRASEASRIEASVVVGADGASSAVARCLGVHALEPGHLAVAVRGYARGVRLTTPFVEIHTSRRTLPGCAWIVPIGEEACNVGIGVIRRGGRGAAPRPMELLEQLRAEMPLFAARLGGAAIGDLKSWYLPLASSGRKLCGDGWVLTGDAASLIDPLTGHGIHNALLSGRLAGETIAGALAMGDLSAAALGSYESLIEERIVRQARRGLPVRHLHSRPFIADLLAAVGSARTFPGRQVRDRLLAMIGHTARRGSLLGLVRPFPRAVPAETGR